MVDPLLIVDRQKIETNIAHNSSCSLALTDFNCYLIFTGVNEKKLNDFTFTAGGRGGGGKNKSLGIPIT